MNSDIEWRKSFDEVMERTRIGHDDHARRSVFRSNTISEMQEP